ncbi:MAG: lectin like domain-containing protein [Actinobacteria bacterium]|nr:lectin like domain-containing protein [Actinomycetota bacterium]
MTTLATSGVTTISLWRSLALVVALMGSVVLVWPAAAGAVGQPLRPQPGPLSQAFVEALHDPLAGAFGKLPNPVEVHLGAAAEAQAARLSLPPAYDLRNQGRLTVIKDQGPYGTCWAFANLAALESRLLPGQRRDFSEDNLVSRSGYGPFAGGRYIWGGWDFMAVAYLTRWAGPVNEGDDPYHTPKLPKAGAVRKHVQAAVMLPGRTGFLDNDLLKEMVVQNGALSVGMFYDDGFDSFDSSAPDRVATATYYCDVAAGEEHDGYTVVENHGVCIVGWDDTFPSDRFAALETGAPPGPGAFLVRNSWGSGYGDHGYFWVSYYDRAFAFDDCTSYARVDDTGNYARNYQYDTLGWTTSWGYPEAPDPSVAWAANRFTAKASEPIVAVGFYAPVAGTSYEVWAGDSLESLSKRGSGVVALPGFTTVDLDTPLVVRARRKFVVAVRICTPGETRPIAVERPAEHWESKAVAKAGQSYMRSGDGDPWFDLADDAQNADANVCIKAYAGR